MDKLFEIENLYQLDALEIFHSRAKSKIIHRTSDIRASGNEIEETVRKIFRNKLPADFYITNGHVVDKKLKSSNQFDVIIADNSTSPVLFTTNDKTDYLTYESVYAIGEIKSSYDKYKTQINDFVDKCKYVYTNLEREPTTPDYIYDNVKLQLPEFMSLQSEDKRPYKNPLFKFMIFVNSDEFDLNSQRVQIGEIFTGNDNKHLPNIICFLDKGIFAYCKTDNNNISSVEVFPEFLTKDNSIHKWTLCEMGNEDFIAASNLAFLMFSITHHLNLCHLLKPNMHSYLQQMFKYRRASFLDVQQVTHTFTFSKEHLEQMMKDISEKAKPQTE
jgi:hypothetical protein